MLLIIIVVLSLSIGYSALNTDLSISGEAIIKISKLILGGQEVNIATSGDGLYKDEYEENRYIYRGQNPDNYIEFNNELWRIISKEADGTYKIIRNDVLKNRPFDEANHRSNEKNTYCTDLLNGCGVYASVNGNFSSLRGSQKGTVTEDSSIKIYLNEDYYVNNINSIAKEQMIEHSFNIGAVEVLTDFLSDNITRNIEGEAMYQWIGNVGLVNVSDILKASINPLCTSASISISDTDACNNNYLLDKGLNNGLYYWTINAASNETGSYSSRAWRGFVDSSNIRLGNREASSASNTARPVVFLKADITLVGSGKISDPFVII